MLKYQPSRVRRMSVATMATVPKPFPGKFPTRVLVDYRDGHTYIGKPFPWIQDFSKVLSLIEFDKGSRILTIQYPVEKWEKRKKSGKKKPTFADLLAENQYTSPYQYGASTASRRREVSCQNRPFLVYHAPLYKIGEATFNETMWLGPNIRTAKIGGYPVYCHGALHEDYLLPIITELMAQKKGVARGRKTAHYSHLQLLIKKKSWEAKYGKLVKVPLWLEKALAAYDMKYEEVE